MKVKQIKYLLNKSIEENTPNLFESIIKEPIVKKEVFSMNTNLEKKSHKKYIIIPAVASLAICCFTFCALYFVQNQVETLLSLDVNPSIELVLNKQEKVIRCNAKNKDAEKIIEGMNLKNIEADIALNAIVGSLYKSGYLEKNSKENDILLSIDNKDKTKTKKLESKYTNLVKNTLKSNNTSGTILIQNDNSTDSTKRLSKEYEISEGKVSLIEKIIEKSPDLNFEKLSNMNINELLNYINTNNIKVDDLEKDDIDDDSDDILDNLNDIKEKEQDKVKDDKEKKEEIIKDNIEKEEEKIKKEQDKIKEEKEKEAEKLKKEQEKIKEEQERIKEKQDKIKEQKDKELEKLKKEQEILKEQQEKEQEKLKDKQEEKE